MNDSYIATLKIPDQGQAIYTKLLKGKYNTKVIFFR